MLKRIVIMLMLVLLLGGAFWQHAYINGLFDEMQTLAAKVQADPGRAAAPTARLNGLWQQNRGILACLLQHEDLESIQMELLELTALVESGQSEAVITSAARLCHYLAHIPESDRICPENIL
ncbi:MAG: DUF4363 family protein [Christensenellaceae bacterium]|nr:DUF4363 family protein [Christensenellaceae bacterium]